jgi:hypothetical protein
MKDPNHEASIEFEPHFQGGGLNERPSGPEQRDLLGSSAHDHSAPDAVEHTVWDEPAILAGQPGSAPEGHLNYARWLESQITETSWAKSLWITWGLILCAGPWAVLGVFINGMAQADVSFAGVLAVVVFGPVTEEITKVAATLWVVEKRPFWFKTMAPILGCAAAGGILFATIENLLYLRVYIPKASAALAQWRWKICTTMHVVCSFVGGLGLARIWRCTM